MKRLFLLLLMVCMLMSITACTSKPNGTPTAQSSFNEKSADANVITNPVTIIEETVKQYVDDNEEFWRALDDFISLGNSFGKDLKRGDIVLETKYDEATNSFACLYDLPVVDGTKEYSHNYYGFIGHCDGNTATIDRIESIQMNKKEAEKFFERNWKN